MEDVNKNRLWVEGRLGAGTGCEEGGREEGRLAGWEGGAPSVGVDQPASLVRLITPSYQIPAIDSIIALANATQNPSFLRQKLQVWTPSCPIPVIPAGVGGGG
ncbi:hypothetical protein Pcinc_043056 [Petrolisthes cinctipes]|uniref:Uncharacterized protein n=1 Tax=Petrolisthes cinctipes TaxID=88211 RepID=A0AAE1EGF5_PETCI|nr:hypothetical protein Pcinc_043056 [Petrolisthes cinctipes]